VSRSRLVPLALGVTVLLAVVGIAARGRPLGSGGGGRGGLPVGFWDYTFTAVVVGGGAILLIMVIGAIVYRARWRRPNGSFERYMYYWLAAYMLFAMFVLVVRPRLRRFGVHLPPTGQAPTGRGPTAQNARQSAGSHVLALRWDEVALLLFIFFVTALIWTGTTRRGRSRRRSETAPEALAAALDDSLDDLRNDRDLRRAIIAAYARMESALAAAGIPRHPAEAPLEYVERALLSLDTSADAVRRLTDLFEWARFSHHEPEPSMRDDAVDALVAVRDELRAAELEPVPA
jgi:Domain of unknown function (DUF4129)